MPATAVPSLRGQFGTDVDVGATLPDGRVEAVVRGASVAVLVWSLAGWGGVIEVVDPPELRTELARIGAELVTAYG